MAKELSCGRATIQRGIEELEKAGYLQKQANGRGKVAAEDVAFPFSSYSYRVLLDTADEPSGVPARGQGGDHQRAGGAHPDGQGVPTPRAPLTKRPSSNDHTLTTRDPPRAPERRGDPSLWEKIRTAGNPKLLAKLDAWSAGLSVDGDRILVEVDRAYADRSLLPLQGDLRHLLGMPTTFRFAGREVH